MLLRSILNLLFPKRCLACGADGGYCCNRCRNVIEQRRDPLVRSFTEQRRDPRARCCAAPLDSLLAACEYGDKSLLARLIHQFKYRFSEDLADFFIAYLGPVLAHRFEPRDVLLVPVPLHPRRKAFRGFNQSELLCQQLSLQYGYRWIPALKRIRNTPPQARLPREARLTNLRGAFAVNPRFAADIRGRSIVLVDDIATTGATLRECAEVLKDAGASKAHGLVVASGR